MNTLWCFLFLSACTVAMLTEQAAGTAAALLSSGQGAVELMLRLMGSMVLWSGLMQILSETGDVALLGRALRRILSPLFGGVKDDACWEAMGMNLSANILGLGNAATPAGIRAAQLLEGQGAAGIRALGMLLALNNSGLQLMPTTVITLRQAAGAANPADVWLPTVVSSAVATVAAAVLMALCNRWEARHG